MLRGHIRHSKAFPASKQETILLAAGVTPKTIYVDNLEGAIKSLRKGDAVAVAGLRGLAGNRKEIVSILDRLHDLGSCAFDAATGRRSDGRYGANLLAEAVADLANEKRGPGDSAVEAGRRGGQKSARSKRKGRMPKADAAKFWFDRTLTNDEALAKMNGDPDYPKEWTAGTAYRNLGKRQAFAGRPTAKKK